MELDSKIETPEQPESRDDIKEPKVSEEAQRKYDEIQEEREDNNKIKIPEQLESGNDIKDPRVREEAQRKYDKLQEGDSDDKDTAEKGISKPGEPYSTFELDGHICETDDKGNIYVKDGKLTPNTTYKLNDSVYTTDDKGRIVLCISNPKRSPENSRDNDAQRETGGKDRQPDDQGGHIVGRDLNGYGGDGNLVAMNSKINQSDYKKMENDIKDALDEGKDVTTKTEITYDGDSERPDKITVTVTIDGKDTVYKFDNNIDGSLMDDIPENGKGLVESVLDENGGEVSSIKEEYDEDGNLKQTTVNITYTGEDGSTYRTKVVIDNKTGGEN